MKKRIPMCFAMLALGSVFAAVVFDIGAARRHAPAEVPDLEEGNAPYPSDVPEALSEILRQYEESMNAYPDFKVSDDMKAELYYNWYDAVKAGQNPPIYYSLQDLTGDGLSELIMGDGLDVRIVYYCGETGDVQFKEDSGRYGMTLYEGGIIEYASGSTASYWQFSEEDKDWKLVESLGWQCGDGGEREQISEEEFRGIVEQYRQKEVELAWHPLYRPD